MVQRQQSPPNLYSFPAGRGALLSHPAMSCFPPHIQTKESGTLHSNQVVHLKGQATAWALPTALEPRPTQQNGESWPTEPVCRNDLQGGWARLTLVILEEVFLYSAMPSTPVRVDSGVPTLHIILVSSSFYLSICSITCTSSLFSISSPQGLVQWHLLIPSICFLCVLFLLTIRSLSYLGVEIMALPWAPSTCLRF